ncbi:MAG: hypothetical protein IJE90_05880 [Clostridia bacterium]|nr:hypothetical protein [Clostridia bacterium]
MRRKAGFTGLSLLAVITVFILCGCTTLSGTYLAQKELGVATSYTFSGDDVIISVAGIETYGTFEVKGDKLIVTVGSLKSEHSFSKNGNSIMIDHVEFFKQ